MKTLLCYALVSISWGVPHVVARASQDWPQIQHDAGHTGCIGQDGPRPPFKVAWSIALDEPLYPSHSMIIGDGRCYVGTGHGNLYALKRETGARLWKYATGAPILGSPAFARGIVYVSSTDRCCHAVQAIDGRRLWTFATGEPIWAAPVVADGKVYVAGRDGFVYALHANSGSLLWRKKIGVMVLATPGYNDGKLFVAGGDLCIYALDGTDGSQLWKSDPVPAQSIRDSWIVVAHGYVLFTSQPVFNNSHDRFQEEVISPWLKEHRDDPVLQEDSIFPRMQAWMKSHPRERTHHILDARTGKVGRIMPIMGVYGGGSAPCPPAVDDEGWAYVFYQNVQAGASGNCYYGRYNLKTDTFESLLTNRYGGPTKFRGRPSHQPPEGEWPVPPLRDATFRGGFAVTDHAWSTSVAGNLTYPLREEGRNQSHNYFDHAADVDRFLIPPQQSDRGADYVHGNFRMYNHSFGTPFAISGKMLFFTGAVGNLVAYLGQ